MKPLPESINTKALILLQQGKTIRQVSQSLHISIGMVSKIWKQHKKSIPAEKRGCPSKVSKTIKSLLARHFSCGKLTTLKEGQELDMSIKGVQVHIQSIHNYLEQEDFKAYVKYKKPELTEDQKLKRFKFAQEHLNWTIKQWRNVMFSDETIISRISSFGKSFDYKRPKDKTIKAHYIKETKQGGGGKIMIWGCITYYGVGDACWFQEKIDSKAYVNALKDYVLQSRDWYSMDPAIFIFQQDGASIHTAEIVKKYILKLKLNLWTGLLYHQILIQLSIYGSILNITLTNIQRLHLIRMNYGIDSKIYGLLFL